MKRMVKNKSNGDFHIFDVKGERVERRFVKYETPADNFSDGESDPIEHLEKIEEVFSVADLVSAGWGDPEDWRILPDGAPRDTLVCVGFVLTDAGYQSYIRTKEGDSYSWDICPLAEAVEMVCHPSRFREEAA